MFILSCALIYDDVIRACTMSTVTADRTGKIVLLTYSLTASHCSTEAHLVGVPLPCSFDSCLVLRQSCSERLKSLAWCGCKKNTAVLRLNKGISCQEKGDKNCSFERCSQMGWPSLDQWWPGQMRAQMSWLFLHFTAQFSSCLILTKQH